jgi:hypothetical protein
MAYGTVNADLMTTSDGVSSSGLYGFKNRIINGAMVIDQRNAGASVTASGAYVIDRYINHSNTDGAYTVQQVTTAPTGFSYSMKATVTTADASIGASQNALISQYIEGYNVADLGFGTANAKTVTLSFWVNSAVTGTFTGALNNSAYDRSYPFSYTISTANTWEQKSVTIAGDTSGTWLTTNGAGIRVWLALSAGSSVVTTAGAWAAGTYYGATGQANWMATVGNTFYLTGVQLEKGSTATSFDYRPYPMELSICERYYEVMYNDSATVGVWGNAPSNALTTGRGDWFYHVAKRAQPTVALASGAAWVGNTATIFPGIDKAHFYSASGYFYSSNTAGTPSLTASAEL